MCEQHHLTQLPFLIALLILLLPEELTEIDNATSSNVKRNVKPIASYSPFFKVGVLNITKQIQENIQFLYDY